MIDRLHQPPGAEAHAELGLGPTAPPPPRWTLRTIRVSVDPITRYTLAGVWHLLHACQIRLRSAYLQQWSPDPDYQPKLAHLLACLGAAAKDPTRVGFVFWDEMGYFRWPAPARDWSAMTRLAEHGAVNNQQWRVIGALNALSGQVDYLDNYIVGRRQVIAMYQKLDQVYAHLEHLYVAQDNWSVHLHPEVLQALHQWPRLEPVWLPTYSPWLNPIEKLWRWLRQAVLKMHHSAGDWPALKNQVCGFLDQFATGSTELLHYAGLCGAGQLARALGVP